MVESPLEAVDQEEVDFEDEDVDIDEEYQVYEEALEWVDMREGPSYKEKANNIL